MWTLVGDAKLDAGARARLALVERYRGAAYRYLLGAVRDPDVADDLLQELAFRFLKGAFSRAAPERGRFRDYLKTVLVHLVTDHQRRRGKAGRRCALSDVGPAVAAWDPAESDRQFVESWRDELLARAWAALAEGERQGGPPYASALRFRVEHPEASSAEMAACLGKQLCLARPMTEAGVRKLLQRARAQFADALLDDVVHASGAWDADALEQELIELGLLKYCRSALDRRRKGEHR